MQDLKLDDEKDLAFSKDDLQLVSDTDELKQTLANLLAIQEGEFAFDDEVGLDVTGILGKDYDETIAEDNIIAAIKQDERVANAEIIDVDTDERQLAVSLAITATDGNDTTETEMEAEIDA